MKTIFSAVAGMALASMAWGGPAVSAKGDYVEARTADVFTGPCFANSEINLTGDTAVMGWHIRQGEVEGVKVDGLSVVAVIRGQATLGDPTRSVYPVKSVLVIDEKAGVEQRIALRKFAEKMGGDLFQQVVKVHYLPVEFAVANNNIHGRQVSLTAGTLAAIQTRALEDKDAICHNESVYFPPLTDMDHAMPAYAVAHDFKGEGLGGTWSSPHKRSAFVGTFSVNR